MDTNDRSDVAYPHIRALREQLDGLLLGKPVPKNHHATIDVILTGDRGQITNIFTDIDPMLLNGEDNVYLHQDRIISPDEANHLPDDEVRIVTSGVHKIAHDPALQLEYQIKRMYYDGFKTTRPMHYFDLGDKPDPNRIVIGGGIPATPPVSPDYHSLSETVIESIDKTRKEINEAIGHSPVASDIYLAGSNMQKRGYLHNARNRTAYVNQLPDKAAAYVIPVSGDIICAQEMMQLLDERLNGKGDTSKPIILYDRYNFWHHLRAGFPDSESPKVYANQRVKQDQSQHDQGAHARRTPTRYDPDEIRYHSPVYHPDATVSPPAYKDQTADKAHPLFAHDKNIWSARTPDQLKSVLAMLEPSPQVMSKGVSDTPLIPDGSTLLVATKTNEKIYELQEMFKDQAVRVMRLDPFTNFSNPEEDRGTFCGNAVKKLESARRDMQRNKTALEQHFKENHVDPDKVFVLAEDSGVYLDDPRIFKHMHREGKFEELGVEKGLVVYADQGPGVEFGPFANSALGERRFWDTVNDTFATLEGKETINRHVHSSSVLALTPFNLAAQNEEEQATRPVYLFSGKTTNWLRPSKEVDDLIGDGVATTGDYLVPNEQLHASFLRAEAKSQTELGRDYLARYSARTKAAETLAKATAMPNGRITLNHLPPLKIGLSDPEHRLPLADEAAYQQAPLPALSFKDASWGAKADTCCASNDVVYLTPPAHPNRLQDLFFFTSLIVSKQLVPRDKDKAIAVNQNDPYWKDFLGLYDHLRRSGMVSDQQDTFLSRFSKENELENLLHRTARNKFIGTPQTPPSELSSKHEERDTSGSFKVAVFCSATARNQPLNDEAEKLGRFIGENSYSLVYGAADKEMMGAVFQGFAHGRDYGRDTWSENATRKIDPLAIGASTPDILQVESKNPQAVVDALDVYHHADTIYDRMQFMFKQADAFTIIPGGAGTVQELAALLCVKEAEKNLPPEQQTLNDKPIFIYNRPLQIDLKGGRQRQGFYEPMITMLGGRETLAKYGVKVCETYQELTHAIEQANKYHDIPQSVAGGAMREGIVKTPSPAWDHHR